VLSGVLVKAGVIGLIRFLPFEAGLPGWGTALVVLGFVTAYYGAAVGFTQTRTKTILAYSTVSQMGLLAVLLGTALVNADPAGLDLVAYYGVHHTLVKGGLFLAVGIMAVTAGKQRWPVLVLTAILALSLGGMPLTGGALAKLAAKPKLDSGLVSVAMSLAGAGSTMLMLHFLRTVMREPVADATSHAPMAEMLPWLVVVVVSLVVPLSLYPAISGESLSYILSPASLWKLLWPMALGPIAMIWLSQVRSLPGSILEGDIVGLLPGAMPFVHRAVAQIGNIDAELRRWPTASLLLIGFAVLLGGALMWRT
jgi:formate hydrogenlyase subunit 3/multisubunit Na+/H+ antiporter MnhD subunit